MSRLDQRESGYVVRSFRPDDLDEFLDLHSQIFGPDCGREWFDWKYEDNPYVDHVPIIVAEADDALAGARPLFALDMSVDGDRHLALQPGDTMVHPDHRRQGVFTRMTEAAIDRYSDGDPSFFFNFPNQQSGPGYLKLGWESVADQATYYRVQNPPTLLEQGSDASWASTVGRALGPLVGGYNRLSNARLGSPDEISVRRFESVPSDTMAALASNRGGDGIHVMRDEQFYDWRFDNPTWDYAAYVAERAGEPITGMVVGTTDEPGYTTTKVTDVAPLPREAPDDGLEALLRRLVSEYDDSDLLAAPPAMSQSAVRRAGFHGDDRPPLSYVGDQTTHVVRTLTGEWTVDGVDITDEANWRLTFSEQDTS